MASNNAVNDSLEAPTISGDTTFSSDTPAILDPHGLELLKFAHAATAVNEITVTNAAAGNLPSITQTGSGDVGMTVEAVTLKNGDVSGTVGAVTPSTGAFTSLTATPTVNDATVMDGNAILTNNKQLVAADFPNSTTLYGENLDSASADAVAAAYTGTTFGTDAAFVVRGAELTAAADVLGNSKYCVFGGSAYLESTNATIIAATGTFSTAIWVYQADWAATAADGIVSCTSANMQNGWEMKLTTTENLTVATYSANATAVMTLTANTAGLSAGWHHICWVHTDAASDKIYIDGNLVASAADTTNAYAAGALELCLGASNNHTALLTGRLDEFALHSATALTADQVKAIYARSAKKFAVKDANTNVYIPELNVASGVYTPVLTNTTNVAASTAYSMPWTRIGNNVIIHFIADVDPTSSAPTDTILSFTLPFACTSTPLARGGAGSLSTAQTGIFGGASATTGSLEFYATSGANQQWQGSFQYVLN